MIKTLQLAIRLRAAVGAHPAYLIVQGLAGARWICAGGDRGFRFPVSAWLVL